MNAKEGGIGMRFTLTECGERLDGSEKRYHLDKRFFKAPLRYGSIRLYQIGRLYCTKKTDICKHSHRFGFELTLVTGGKGTVYTNDIPIPVAAGDIYLSFPGDFHAIESDPVELLEFDFISFDTDRVDLSEDLEEIMRNHADADARVVRSDSLRSLVGNAIAELDREDHYSKELLDSIFTQIPIHLIRLFRKKNFKTESEVISEPEILCYRLMNYVDTHIYTMTSLEELSEVTSYNYTYLSALFRKVTGGTLAAYYRGRRLETARLLLEEKKTSISKIAELLNYSSIYTFSRAFKEKYGQSPEQYRKTRET
jgi:AraC-like DNA-binding protein